jgi:hypothetical protein
MALPTLTKTWQISSNQLLNALGNAGQEGRQFWLAIKDVLTGFGASPWVVAYSCDGATAGVAGDGVDRWPTINEVITTTSDVGARSWVVLQNSGTGQELLIDMRVSSTTSNRAPTVLTSWTDGFTGGTTTSRPTAPDQQDLSDNHSTSFTVGLGTPSSSTSRAYRLHVLHTTDGEFTVVLVCFDNNCTGTWFFGKPLDAVSGWADACVAGINGGNSDANTGEGSQSLTLVLGRDTGFERFYGNFPTNSSAPWLLTSIAVGDLTLNAQLYGVEDTPTINEISAEWDVWTTSIRCRTAGDRGVHGRLPDIYLVSEVLNTGDTFPSGGTREWAVFGALVVPWDGTVPLVA